MKVRIWRVLLPASLLATLLVAPPAGSSPDANPKLAALGDKPELAKVAGHLLEAQPLAIHQAELLQANPPRYVTVENGLVEVEIMFHGLTSDVADSVIAAGLQRSQLFFQFGIMTGFVEPGLLGELASIPQVASIHPNYGKASRVGATTSQGDWTIKADQARAAFGVDGTGVSVGVISDSFNDTIGGSVTGFACERSVTGTTPQGSGDLPPVVKVIDPGPGGGTDEGAGMAELVTDLAPGAEILFHADGPTRATFAQGIIDLADCGADIIVDDVIYLAEPMFQDGIIAQSVQTVHDRGVAYFTSAGNNGSYGIDDFYTDIDPLAGSQASVPTGVDFHDFGGGDAFAEITVPAGGELDVVLNWNDPWSGSLGPGASSDLDLHLYAAPDVNSTLLESSANGQGCSLFGGPPGGTPLEILGYANTSNSPETVYLAVDHYCGPKTERIRVVVFDDGPPFSFEPGVFTDSTIFGHASSPAAVTLAAVDYREIESGGTFDGEPGINVEPFSSLGGRIPIYFDPAGNPLPGAPVNRLKPDIAGPDGTNTTFFGSGDTEGDGFPNFYGTSAAAPHAAAVAALMLERNPARTPAATAAILENTALDIEPGAPAIGPDGSDSLSGFGLIDALAAVGGNIRPVASDDGPYTVTTGETLTVDAAAGILGNDSDPDGDELTSLLSGGPTSGVVALSADGAFTYIHDGGPSASDSFTYVANDGTVDSEPATVTIEINPPNSPPTALNDGPFEVVRGATLAVEAAEGVLSNDDDPDGDQLSVAVVDEPSHGILALGPAGSFTYRHNGGPSTSDSFTYVANDGRVDSTPAIVGINVVSGVTVGLVNTATGQWHLRDEGGAVRVFYFGTPGDIPIIGDWDCDGDDTPGLYRQSDGFVYLRNTNDTGIGTIRFFLGIPGDIPLAGDFDGDGCDTVSVYRPGEGRVFIANRLGANEGFFVADYDYFFGNPGDKPWVGDFTGNGVDTIGLHRESSGFVYFTEDHPTGPVATTDNSFFYGIPNDRLLAADWTDDGIDTVAIYRPQDARFYFRFSNTIGTADDELAFGESSWVPIAGVFGLVPENVPALTFGDGVHRVGIDIQPGTYRNSTFSGFCAWERLSGFGGGRGDIIVDNLTTIRQLVTIFPTDAGFSAEDCGIWSSDLSPITTSTVAPFGDGMYQVGVDIAPGTWQSPASESCFWERLSGFSGELSDTIINDFTNDASTVAIAPTDVGFSAERCGMWTRLE